jgi:hypothetical protein
MGERLARQVILFGRTFSVESDEGRRRVTADSAVTLGEALGTGPEFWLDRLPAMSRTVADPSRMPVLTKQLSDSPRGFRL